MGADREAPPVATTTDEARISQAERARMGARATLKKYGRKQLREWGKMGGSPRKKKRKA